MRKLRVRSLLCLWLSSTVVLSSSLAFAAPPVHASTEDDATVAMARERFKEGVSFFDLKQYDKARAAFLQAYALKKHPAVLLNLAQSELRSGHEADAAGRGREALGTPVKQAGHTLRGRRSRQPADVRQWCVALDDQYVAFAPDVG